MKITNYNSIRHKIRRYSSNVAVNLDKAGWIEVQFINDVTGEKSVNLIERYHKAVKNPDATEYCYRRFNGAWGIPLLFIYVRGG